MGVQCLEIPETRRGIAVQHGIGDGEDEAPIGGAQYGTRRFGVERGITGREQLLQQRLSVAQAALGLARHQCDHLARHAHLFGGRGALEVRDQLPHADAAEIVALAARHDRGQHLVRIGGGEHELGMRRRLFERLQ